MEATAQQWEAKARLDEARARDQRRQTKEPPSGADMKLARVMQEAKGEALRLSLDRTVAATSILSVVGLLAPGLILNARVLGSILKNPRLGVIRFTAKSIGEMLPNAQKMRLFTFTPITGAITAGLVNAVIGVAVVLIFVAAFIPIYIVTNPIEAVWMFGASVVSIFL